MLVITHFRGSSACGLPSLWWYLWGTVWGDLELAPQNPPFIDIV